MKMATDAVSDEIGASGAPEDRQSVSERPRSSALDADQRLSEPRADGRGSTQMMVALAHELNQPLTAAANYLSAARALASDNGAAVDALDKAATQIIRAGRLVSRMRELLARGEADLATQSLHELIRRASLAVDHPGVSLTLRLEAAEDLVRIDCARMEQALVDLIRSAIDAIAGAVDGRVTIATSLANQTLQTEIVSRLAGSDLGGTSFDPSASSNVGLPMAHSIIEAHCGRLSVRSQWGSGAKYTFVLPLAGSGSG
jgi:C4-dicarboxylate-specific signal transduction histidine kinase